LCGFCGPCADLNITNTYNRSHMSKTDEKAMLTKIEETALHQQLHALQRAKAYKPADAYAVEMTALRLRMSQSRGADVSVAQFRQELVREGIVAPSGGDPKIGDTYCGWS